MRQKVARRDKPKCRVITGRELKLGDIFFCGDELAVVIVCPRPDYRGFSHCKVVDMMGGINTLQLHVDAKVMLVTDERVRNSPEA